MFLLEFLQIIIVYTYFFQSARVRSGLLKHVQQLWETLYQQSEGEGFDENMDLCFVKEQLREAQFEGRPLHGMLDAIAAQFLKSLEYQMQKQRCVSVLSGRALVVLSLAILVRMGLSLRFGLQLNSLFDFLSIVLAGVLTISLFQFLENSFPKSWFWDKKLQIAGKNWIQTLVGSRTPSLISVAEAWNLLVCKELEQGISLSFAKQQVIHNWAMREEIASQQKKTLFEDLVPLIEFAGLGLSVLLLVGRPIWQILSR